VHGEIDAGGLQGRKGSGHSRIESGLFRRNGSGANPDATGGAEAARIDLLLKRSKVSR
jgi:hypothetical protein